MRPRQRPENQPFPTSENQRSARPYKTLPLAFVLVGAGLVMTGAAEEPLIELPGNPLAASLSVVPATFGNLAWTDVSCGNCHTRDTTFSHPVGVPAAPPPGKNLVLNEGRVACTTCHDDSDYAAHDRSIQTGDPMLRMPAETLCISCHASDVGTSNNGHALAQHEAHTQTRDERDEGPTPFAQELDTRSRQCLVCHDGMVAADADARPRLIGDMFSKNHPVGMVYPTHDRVAGELRLHTEANRDPRVRLFDGVVACETCHNVYSDNRAMLVIDNIESRLCMACHNL
jgi:hypothetical protein